MQILDSKRLKNRKSRSKLGFTTTGGSTGDGWDRFISLGDEQLFHLGNICDTCEFFFRRTTDRIIPSLEIERIRAQLESGLDRISDTALAFTDIIPNGNYIVALFRAQPRKAGTDQMPDYFTHEQRFAWRQYDDQDLTAAPSYYRGESRAIQDQQMLFEFFIPLYHTTQLDNDRIAQYKHLIESGVQPTAVSLSVLDVKSSELWPVAEDGKEITPEFGTHWCFANYLLDGHHKVFASHVTGQPITILSFISLDHSWIQVNELMALYENDSKQGVIKGGLAFWISYVVSVIDNTENFNDREKKEAYPRLSPHSYRAGVRSKVVAPRNDFC